MALYTCNKCGKTMEEGNFYTYKTGEKTELCKKCLTMHIDNFDPSTFLWLLQKMDVPYIEEEWNVLRDKAFAKDPKKMNGSSVFGKYLSKMKLRQWKDYSWADTEKLKALTVERNAASAAEREAFEADIRKQYESGEIPEAEYKTLISAQTQHEEYEAAPIIQDVVGADNSYQEDDFLPEEELTKMVDLTSDEKMDMAMKWGRLYKPLEWAQLELLYNQFMESFDIQGAARLDTLKKICKTSLKMDQSIDCGDIEGYQKLSRVYDALMKSAKFTEAQRKEEKAGDFDCVGSIVNFAESQKGGGKIARYKIEVPYDLVDKTIIKLKDYYTTLVNNDPSIKQLIENYIKKREIAAEQKKDRLEAEANGQKTYEISDKDIIAHKEYEEEQRQLDQALSAEEE